MTSTTRLCAAGRLKTSRRYPKARLLERGARLCALRASDNALPICPQVSCSRGLPSNVLSHAHLDSGVCRSSSSRFLLGADGRRCRSFASEATPIMTSLFSLTEEEEMFRDSGEPQEASASGPHLFTLDADQGTLQFANLQQRWSSRTCMQWMKPKR